MWWLFEAAALPLLALYQEARFRIGRTADERPLPRWRDDARGCDDELLVPFVAGQSDRNAAAHSEVVEALSRVDALATLGAACGVTGAGVVAARLRELLLDSGVVASVDAPGLPVDKARPGWHCLRTNRITRGEARALLSQFAAEIANGCRDARLGEVLRQVEAFDAGRPLTEPVAARVVGLAPWVWWALGVVVLTAGGLYLWRAAR
jgi:hypothetical protein